ncbi:MAG: hypothetical protein FJ319_10780 [SAR202 cluster bacterium]|nr:hypothetical protein [SAR202 cluster bacterium]
MTLRDTLSKLKPGTITTIAGSFRKEGVPAKEADAGWPLGVVRWHKTGELVIADYHMNVLWRINKVGILHRLAGTGVPGYTGDGGQALEAQLSAPHDLAQDRKGNLYFSDLANQVYRRIDVNTGIITTVIGSGKLGRGGNGGPATEAELDTHCGIAIADNGDIYISSEWANDIRKVDAKTGIITHFAGYQARDFATERGNSRPTHGPGLSLGGYSGDNGPAETVAFYHPEHLAFDTKGNLYVCDNSNDRVRKIDMKTRTVTTVIGNGQRASNGDGGPATEASILMPDAIFVDVHDNLYVGEKYGCRVRKVDAKTGIVTTIAGNGQPGFGEEDVPGTESTCNVVEVGLWADPNGDVFYGDTGGRLRKVDGKTGIVSTVLGGTSVHDNGPAINGFLCGPAGICAAPDGTVYLADQWGQRIRSIDAGGTIRTVAGNGARAYGGDGGQATQAYLGNPMDVAVDSRGRIVICDTRHSHVRRVELDGTIHNVAGAAFPWDRGDGGPAVCATLVHPISVTVGPNDDIYIGDTIGRIRKVDSKTGIITTVAGIGISGYTGDGGPATKARIGSPNDIAFDRAGNMYFADSASHVIRKVDAKGTITTVAGIGKKGFSPDGAVATKAAISRPQGVAIKGDGTVYFSDSGNNRVSRITKDGKLETVAGAEKAGYHSDGGPAAKAGLSSPSGLCFYGNDVLLISDHFNHLVRAVRL